jgi:hypothetical protein
VVDNFEPPQAAAADKEWLSPHANPIWAPIAFVDVVIKYF